jgi:hypothetical protein
MAVGKRNVAVWPGFERPPGRAFFAAPLTVDDVVGFAAASRYRQHANAFQPDAPLPLPSFRRAPAGSSRIFALGSALGLSNPFARLPGVSGREHTKLPGRQEAE